MINFKGYGKMVKKKLEYFIMLTDKSMMGNLKMINSKEQEHLFIPKNINIKDNGKTV